VGKNLVKTKRHNDLAKQGYEKIRSLAGNGSITVEAHEDLLDLQGTSLAVRVDSHLDLLWWRQWRLLFLHLLQ
jgi:hypothetical protein